jgi:hypothetical protein
MKIGKNEFGYFCASASNSKKLKAETIFVTQEITYAQPEQRYCWADAGVPVQPS